MGEQQANKSEKNLSVFVRKRRRLLKDCLLSKAQAELDKQE